MSEEHIAINDPVAKAVQAHLRSLAELHQCKLIVDGAPPEVRLTFANYSTSAETHDIAFVRIAGLLINDARFGDSVAAILRTAIDRMGQA
jgi:hypothetical protein